MQRVSTCLLAVTLAACGASRTPGRISGLATISVGGILVLASLTEDTTHENFADALHAGIQAQMALDLGILTAAFGVGALLVNELRTPTADDPEPPPPPPPPPIVSAPRIIPNGDRVQAPPTSDARLHQLTLQASFAARAGQCTAVRVIADRIEDLDETYRSGGFIADPEIRRCL